MKNLPRYIPTPLQGFRFNVFLVISFLFFLLPFNLYSQVKDTVYIKFNEQHEEMVKDDFTRGMQAGSPDEELKKSISYYIEQMEPPDGYDYRFIFTHANHPKKAYEKFGGEPPAILYKEQSFLKGKKVLDVNFFRTTPYLEIAKTFEEEDSWKEDVMIFMIDEDEIKNDSIVLRQVDFSRPVKE